MAITRDEADRLTRTELIENGDTDLGPLRVGAILAETMAARGLSAAQLARMMAVNASRVTDLLSGKRPVTADTALRLGAVFGTSARLWLGLQSQADLERAEGEIDLAQLSRASAPIDPPPKPALAVKRALERF